ncbi:HAMP domain-containing protein [Deinobacterium chartae]|uniref:HAMP domain-containing protein n=1 Tax=Deinobacterium chartae TaxID=521158 RepID=A0A841HW74_9DEIO|nr:HAMP domain-containing protein [Deinobacterium chartae]MBB6097166.1 HAMP domain-containing protein [Deinobacterium chartae]
MSDTPTLYSVRLLRAPTDPGERSDKAAQLAPKLGITPERAERFLERSGVNIVKPTSLERAQLLVSLLAEIGVAAEEVPASPPPAAATATFPVSSAAPVGSPAPAATPATSTTGFASAHPTSYPAAPSSTATLSGAAVAEPIASPATDRFSGAENASLEDDLVRKPKGWVSLRWKLLALALIPIAVMGAAWVVSVFTSQARDNRELLVQGAVQTASVFSKSILDLQESSGQNLSNSELRANVQQRAQDLFDSGLLPLNTVIVTDASGNVIAAYDRTFARDNAPDSAFTEPVQTWKNSEPEVYTLATTMAKDTIKYRPPSEGAVKIDMSQTSPLARVDGNVILAAYPLPGGGGATLLALNSSSLQAQVSRSVTNTLFQLIVVLGATAALTALFAAGIIGRLVGLARTADRISLGDLEDPIESKGRDEIDDLADAVERMRSSLEAAMARLG